MIATKLENGEYKIEFRVWTPLEYATPDGPSLTVYTRTGTAQEIASHMKREILDWAANGEIGPLMSIAELWANDLVNNLERREYTSGGG